MIEPPAVQIELAVMKALLNTDTVILDDHTRVKFENITFSNQGDAVVATILTKQENGDWNEVFHAELRTDQSQIANWEYELFKGSEVMADTETAFDRAIQRLQYGISMNVQAIVALKDFHPDNKLCDDCADTIEQLEAEIVQAKSDIETFRLTQQHNNKQQGEKK